MEWQPIETAPKDGMFIIACDKQNYGARYAYPAWWCDVFGRWETMDNNRVDAKLVNREYWVYECKPTHWQPMPEPRPLPNPHPATP